MDLTNITLEGDQLRAIADRAGISYPTVWRWYTKKTSRPYKLRKIRRAAIEVLKEEKKEVEELQKLAAV